MPNLTKTVIFILTAGTFTMAPAIIVWNGEIVSEWPDQRHSSLHKTAASSGDSTPAEGFGIYPHPVGTIYGLTMIVDFSDEPAKFTREQIIDWLNKPGFSMGSTNGSVRDYFFDCSNGKLELLNDVFGYYRAAKPRSYYEGRSGYSGADELVAEMIDHFDPEVDFSKYDNDHDGRTDAVSIVYAGTGKTWGQGLWPHAGNYGKKKDGVRFGRYNMSDMGPSLTLYVFCHETGHMLFGWPDLYWFGDYCIMGNRMSDANPQAINDFFRADQGWIPTTDIAPDDNGAFTAAHNGGGFRCVNPSVPREMFYWSVIKTDGRWSNVKGDGILLYHFDGRIGGNTSGKQRTLYVVEADGNNALAAEQWPNPGYNARDFFNRENNAEFSVTTKPASSWGLKIYDISEAGATMTFKVGTGTVALDLQAIGGEGTTPPFYSAEKTRFDFDLLGRCINVNRNARRGASIGIITRPVPQKEWYYRTLFR